MSDPLVTVPVNLGSRSYDIIVGPNALGALGEGLDLLLSRSFVVIVTDENVAKHHLARTKDALGAAGIACEAIILPAGEATKSFTQLEFLTGQLLELGVERSDVIVALGGGVIGDLTGFAAATLRRGLRFVQVPTSLLAQVDSSVGGKTAINVPQGKNLIGAFHQPSLVIADVSLLETLDPRQLKAGYAEVVKYGVLGDLAFFNWLEKNSKAMLAGGANALPFLKEAVAHSVRMKAQVVANDETEQGARALLNFGHTFGHALEAATGFSDRLFHGEGVAIGMGLALDLSAKLGHGDAVSAARLRAHLKSAGLPATLKDIDGIVPSAAELLDHMRQDKKVAQGQLTLILARRIGEAFIEKDVSADVILELLTASGATS